jgi:hypothetical protein
MPHPACRAAVPRSLRGSVRRPLWRPGPTRRPPQAPPELCAGSGTRILDQNRRVPSRAAAELVQPKKPREERPHAPDHNHDAGHGSPTSQRTNLAPSAAGGKRRLGRRGRRDSAPCASSGNPIGRRLANPGPGPAGLARSTMRKSSNPACRSSIPTIICGTAQVIAICSRSFSPMSAAVTTSARPVTNKPVRCTAPMGRMSSSRSERPSLSAACQR